MSKSQIITVCHGDAWSSNMMFSEADDHVTLIDFQMIGLSHPARDLWYLLATSTDKVCIEPNEHLEVQVDIYVYVPLNNKNCGLCYKTDYGRKC